MKKIAASHFCTPVINVCQEIGERETSCATDFSGQQTNVITRSPCKFSSDRLQRFGKFLFMFAGSLMLLVTWVIEQSAYFTYLTEYVPWSTWCQLLLHLCSCATWWSLLKLNYFVRFFGFQNSTIPISERWNSNRPIKTQDVCWFWGLCKCSRRLIPYLFVAGYPCSRVSSKLTGFIDFKKS